MNERSDERIRSATPTPGPVVVEFARDSTHREAIAEESRGVDRESPEAPRSLAPTEHDVASWSNGGASTLDSVRLEDDDPSSYAGFEASDTPPPGAKRRVWPRLAAAAAAVAAVVTAVSSAGDGASSWEAARSSFQRMSVEQLGAQARDAVSNRGAQLLHSWSERDRSALAGLGERGLPTARGGSADDADASQPAAPWASLNRAGHSSIPGGIVVLPESFVPGPDGSYDLLLHFHGNTAVVRESVDVAQLNAVVAIVNLGIGSAPYEEAYAMPGTYEALLDNVALHLRKRGLSSPRLRRVALSGWSAGYGAIWTILKVRRGNDDLDAILMLDGIHCGWEDGKLNARQMKPFALAAEKAAKGDLLFAITHSEIDPMTYASTTATADYLLDSVGGKRRALDPVSDAPPYLSLESMKGAVAQKLEKTMDPTSEARIGDLHVVGYRGETKEHHMAHLFQMGATLLPQLAERWRDIGDMRP